MKRGRWRNLVGLLVVAAPSQSLAAGLRIFSYDPANAETRRVAGALSFEFHQGLTSATVLQVLATEGDAQADVRPAAPREIGTAALSALERTLPERSGLYAVQSADQGAALISAFCPGAKRAWMAFGKIKYNRDLRVVVLGDNGPKGETGVCLTLDFNFHGEWRLPPGKRLEPHRLEPPSFPNS